MCIQSCCLYLQSLLLKAIECGPLTTHCSFSANFQSPYGITQNRRKALKSVSFLTRRKCTQQRQVDQMCKGMLDISLLIPNATENWTCSSSSKICHSCQSTFKPIFTRFCISSSVFLSKYMGTGQLNLPRAYSKPFPNPKHGVIASNILVPND